MLRIERDDLSGPDIAAFLMEHLAEMRATSPPESMHALDLEGLRQPNIIFWTVRDITLSHRGGRGQGEGIGPFRQDARRDGIAVAGCGALKTLSHDHAEVKSMRTAPAIAARAWPPWC